MYGCVSEAIKGSLSFGNFDEKAAAVAIRQEADSLNRNGVADIDRHKCLKKITI